MNAIKITVSVDARDAMIADRTRKINALQAIQKTHPQYSAAWMQASEMLQPLFKQMAKLTEK